MNNNILSNIHSYIDLYSLSNILYNNKTNVKINKDIMEHLSNVYKTSYDNIKYRINNCQNRCGKCQELFKGDYIIRICNINCKACGENEKFNIEFCQKCFKTNVKRGELHVDYCLTNNHKIVYLGINILS